MALDLKEQSSVCSPYWIIAIDVSQAIGIALKAAQDGPFKGNRYINLKAGFIEVPKDALVQVQ